MNLPKAGLSFFVAWGLLWPVVGAAAEWSGHADALTVTSATKDAIHKLDDASRLTTDDPDAYKGVARDVLQELTGGTGPMEDSSGYHKGAIGQLSEVILHGTGRPWQQSLQSAWASLTVAALQLHDSLRARDLDSFQSSATKALEALMVALGRDSGTGSLAGLEGALATTELGVPDGAKIVDGCQAPTQAPSYGLTQGYLMYVAVSASGPSITLPQSHGIQHLSAENGIIVLQTAAAEIQPSLCGNSHAAATPSAEPASSIASASVPLTEAQAIRGEAVYAARCAVCHGDHMEGKSAPPIAGTVFLKKAQALDWTADNLRTVVVTTMPRDNPGTLSPAQYADVIAFLLASDCYRVGQTAFPTTPTPTIQHAALQIPPDNMPGETTQGVCPLEGSGTASR